MQPNPEKIYSIIDLGTNTCLLLIASLFQNKLTKLYEAQEIPRLGKDLYKTGSIASECFEKVSEIFKKYISISEEYNAERILAFGTSALREAKNNFEFIEFIEKKTGIKIKVIPGEEEAHYGFAGTIFDLNDTAQYAVLDIGGGSTELSFIENKKLKSISLKIGSVRLFEKFFKENFNNDAIFKAQLFVKEMLSELQFNDIKNKQLVGVAGTLTTLSAIKNRLKDFSEKTIHKTNLTLEEVKNIFQSLIKMTDNERLSLGNFMKGRSDVIICGSLILSEIMGHFNYDSIIVSTKGLRYGLLLNSADFIY